MGRNMAPEMKIGLIGAGQMAEWHLRGEGGIVPLRNGRLSGLRPLEPPALKRSGGAVTCQRVLPAPGPPLQ